jgi:hypothetical protein
MRMEKSLAKGSNATVPISSIKAMEDLIKVWMNILGK